MTVDPTDPETFDDEAQAPDPEDRDVEAPDAEIGRAHV